MGGMVSLWGASSLIRSRQQGNTSIGAGSSTVDTTITAIDMANTILVHEGWYHNITNGARPRDSWVRIKLLNSTTVRVIQDTAGSSVDGVVYWTVLQFAPGVIRQIQRNSVTIGSGTGTGTTGISEIDLAKSLLIYNGWTYTGTEAYSSTDPKNWLVFMYASSSTVVTAARPGTGNSVNLEFEMVEFF